MKDIEVERARPIVVLETLQEIPFYGVRLRNAGLTAARDVVIRTEPEIELCFYDPEKPPIRFLKEKIDFLPPNASCQAMLGKMPDIQRVNNSLVYRGTIQYTDATGHRYTEAVALDYTLFNGTWYSGRHTIRDIVEELEKMRGAIENMGNGFDQLRIATQRLGTDREENRDLQEKSIPENKEKYQVPAMARHGDEV